MNNMKEVKIIQAKTEPNKNHLWLSDEGLKQFKGDGWEQVLSNDGGNGREPELININDINLEQSSEQKNIIMFSATITKEQYDSIADASLNDNIKLLFNGQYVLFVKCGKFVAVNGEQQGATMLLQILQSGEDVDAMYLMTIKIITTT